MPGFTGYRAWPAGGADVNGCGIPGSGAAGHTAWMPRSG